MLSGGGILLNKPIFLTEGKCLGILEFEEGFVKPGWRKEVSNSARPSIGFWKNLVESVVSRNKVYIRIPSSFWIFKNSLR